MRLSAVKRLVPFSPDPAPPMFQTVVANDVTENSLTVRWTTADSGVEAYNLEWELKSDPGTVVGQVSGITTLCRAHLLSLLLTKNYAFRLSCVCCLQEGGVDVLSVVFVSPRSDGVVSWRGLHLHPEGRQVPENQRACGDRGKHE